MERALRLLAWLGIAATLVSWLATKAAPEAAATPRPHEAALSR
jgi:hypothetical protein